MSPEKKSDDALSREIEDALEGVNLQELGGREEPAAKGERLYKGVIVGVTGDDVIVDLGPRMQGVVSKREFEDPPEVGSVFEFMLRGREDELWILSRRDAQALSSWNELETGSLVKARVTGQNTGGLELKIGSHDAFMPASQVSLDRDDDISSYIGQTLTCEVLEIDRKRKRVLLSRRRVLGREAAEEREETVGKLAPGLVLTGKVTRIESFGAFVDVGGIEGLVHVSNLSRRRVEHAEEIVKKGQEVRVQVLEIKEGGKRIGLGMKQLEPDPWDDVHERIGKDSIHAGTVTRVVDFGAFVELQPGLEGLLHVSQLGRDQHVRRVSDVLKVGQEISVRVAEIDAGKRRLSLSLLDTRGAVLGSDEAAAAEVIDEVLDSSQHAPQGTNLGALFKKALGDKKP